MRSTATTKCSPTTSKTQTRKIRGTCYVEGVEGAFTAVPRFDLLPPYASRTFYAAWDVDEKSIARLNEVVLIDRA